MGGCNLKKQNVTANFKFGTVFWVFCLFSGFFGFSILANFDWFNGFLLKVVLVGHNSFYETFAGLCRH